MNKIIEQIEKGKTYRCPRCSGYGYMRILSDLSGYNSKLGKVETITETGNIKCSKCKNGELRK